MIPAAGDLLLQGGPFNWTFDVEARPRDGPPITLTLVVDVISLATLPLHTEAARLEVQRVSTEMLQVLVAFKKRGEIITEIVALNDAISLHLQGAVHRLGFEVTGSRISRLTDVDGGGISFVDTEHRLVPLQEPTNGPNLQDEALMREIQGGENVVHVAVLELNREGGAVAVLDVQAELFVPDNNNIHHFEAPDVTMKKVNSFLRRASDPRRLTIFERIPE